MTPRTDLADRHGTLTGYNSHGCRCEKCIDYYREYQREWNRKNADKISGYNKRWRAANPEKVKAAARRGVLQKFGMTQEDYDALLTSQGGGCAICGLVELRGDDRYMPVDHDHETGAVRGILCPPCNNGIGHFRDDPERVDRAAAYLRKYQ